MILDIKLKPEAGIISNLKDIGSAPIKNPIPLGHLLRRSEIYFEHLIPFAPGLEDTEDAIREEVETRIKYEGYIKRQEQDVARLKKMEDAIISENLDYEEVYGLTREVREKLNRVKPLSLGQASRISGVTPAAIMAIQIHFKKQTGNKRILS